MRLYCFKENRLFCEPTSSATRTGGLNFLIADAPLIMCHSLFPQATNQADMFACPFGGAYLLGNLEKGKYNPSLVLAWNIAKVFDVSIEEIFTVEN